MDPIRIGIRGLIAFALLLGLMRLSGKRTISRGTPFDFVLALVLGDMIDDMLWAEVPVSQFLVGTTVLVMAHVGLTHAALIRTWLARLIEGRPTPLLAEGRLHRPGMRSERVNEEELAELLRLEGVDGEEWEDVEAARLESSGQLSVAKEDGARPAQKVDVPRLRPR